MDARHSDGRVGLRGLPVFPTNAEFGCRSYLSSYHGAIETRREPDDDLLHPPDDDPNYNESRYYSFFDRVAGMGGWVRMGNRPNQGHTELTICLYLPDGRVGFMFKRPAIDGNSAHDAGGLKFEVIEPYRAHRVSYDGKVCVLAQPRDMADPKKAFAENPHVPCALHLELTSAAQATGGEPEYGEGEEPDLGHEFGRGHTEQQMVINGSVRVGEQSFAITDAYGLRDHSWGPRVWQSIPWYRWLIASFGTLGIAATIRGEHGSSERLQSGYVYDVTRYGDDRAVPVRTITLTTDYDDAHFPIRNCAVVTTDDHAYELTGEIWSSIPLRNRRDDQVTRITENATRWTCEGITGTGMSEYLDLIIDDLPIGISAHI